MEQEAAQFSIMQHFADLDDPRVLRTQRHNLVSILIIAICAVICGADGWGDLEEFGKTKQQWFRSFLDLPNGIPSYATFRRVFMVLNATAFGQCFIAWVNELIVVSKGQVIAVDGKTLRRSHDAANGKAAIHMVSAWASANRVVLGQYKVNDKSNEITAIPTLLKLLAIKGCTVTIDAMGCQAAITKTIREAGADYVLGVKENQKTLYQAIEHTFRVEDTKRYRGIDHTTYSTTEKDHGRIEKRRYVLIRDTDYVAYCNPKGAWEDLNGIGMVEAQRVVNGERTKDRRYYITSGHGNASGFATAVRSHWGIENSLHWVLDIAFREDDSRIRSGYADQNFAVLRHIALNLIRQEPGKGSVKTKRLKAGWDEAYLLKILLGPEVAR